MDAILLAVALVVMVAGGGAVAVRLARDRVPGRLELLGLAILLGTALVTLAPFWLGRIVAGWPLRLGVVALSIALASGLGWRRLRGGPRAPGALAVVAVAAATLLVAWIAAHTTLGWDGAGVWELKARIAAENGGHMPAAYYTDPSRRWTHPYYPLLVPFAEWWFYGWAGAPDQRLAKAVFPLLFLGGAAVLAASACRLGGRWSGPMAVVLLSCVPEVLGGSGGITTGYADFPLAIYYAAAIAYVVEYHLTGSRGALMLASGLAAALPWIKQEGVLALAGVFAVGLAATARGRRFRDLGVLVAPGAAVWLAWRAFLVAVGAPQAVDFMPLTVPTLLANASRLPTIADALFRELGDRHHWSVLWPAAAVALAAAGPGRRRLAGLLALAVVVPLGLASSAYVMSAWDPFIVHVRSSLARLVLQVAPVAVLLVAVSLAPPPRSAMEGPA